MLTRRSLISAIAALGATCAMPVKAVQEKDTLPKPPTKLVLGQNEVEQLVLLMDTDKNGKISKAEWMDFMSAEFDRLDTDHSGELDVKEIAQSRLRATRRVNTGK
jgi:EF hand